MTAYMVRTETINESDSFFVYVEMAVRAFWLVGIIIFQATILAPFHETIGQTCDKRDQEYICGWKYMKISNLILLVALGIAIIGLMVTWDWPNS